MDWNDVKEFLTIAASVDSGIVWIKNALDGVKFAKLDHRTLSELIIRALQEFVGDELPDPAERGRKAAECLTRFREQWHLKGRPEFDYNKALHHVTSFLVVWRYHMHEVQDETDVIVDLDPPPIRRSAQDVDKEARRILQLFANGTIPIARNAKLKRVMSSIWVTPDNLAKVCPKKSADRIRDFLGLSINSASDRCFVDLWQAYLVCYEIPGGHCKPRSLIRPSVLDAPGDRFRVAWDSPRSPAPFGRTLDLSRLRKDDRVADGAKESLMPEVLIAPEIQKTAEALGFITNDYTGNPGAADGHNSYTKRLLKGFATRDQVIDELIQFLGNTHGAQRQQVNNVDE